MSYRHCPDCKSAFEVCGDVEMKEELVVTHRAKCHGPVVREGFIRTPSVNGNLLAAAELRAYAKREGHFFKSRATYIRFDRRELAGIAWTMRDPSQRTEWS